jgi:hypothetical protein
MNRSEGPKGTMGPTPFSRVEPPSSGRWKSTEVLKEGNDAKESPAMRLVRQRREKLADCRRCLRTMRDETLPHKTRINGTLSILAVILDELEAP